MKKEEKNKVKELFKNANLNLNNPDVLYEEIWDIINKWNLSESDNHIFTKWLYLDNLNGSHLLLSEIFEWGEMINVVEFTNELIKEYWCNSYLEKSLCEVVALNYVKLLQISKCHSLKIKNPSISKEKNWIINSLSKDLERANRNYFSAFNTLKDLRKPAIKINVNSDIAIIWNNQQINNEIIKH